MSGDDHWIEATKEANKEHMLRRCFGDCFVEMLRAARSPGTPHHLPTAAKALSDWLDMLSHEPKSSALDVVEAAVSRFGFPNEPTDPLDRHLVDVARAGISYLLAAADVGRPGAGFMSRRKSELIRAINEFKDFQAERRQLRNS